MTALPRREREARAFRNSLETFHDPFEALNHIYGSSATWSAVHLVAEALIGREVKGVWLAWGIIEYVNKLPDGKERLRKACEDALHHWEESP